MAAEANVAFTTVLRGLAASRPDEPCLEVDGNAISFGGLDRRANALAWDLHASGITAGDLVAIALPTSADFFCAAFAVWKVGATPLPIAASLPPVERAVLLDVAKPRAVVDEATDDERQDPPVHDVVALRSKACASGGSTGRPKVIVDHGAAVLPLHDSLGFGHGDGPALFVGGPVHHTAPLQHAVEGMLRGRLVCMQQRFSAEGALDAIATHRAHFAWLVPTMMRRIARLPQAVKERYDISCLRYLYHGAAPCSEWLKREWIEWIGPTSVFEVYGSTESIAATKIRGDEWRERPGSVGRAVVGEVRICTDDGRDLASGRVGEIYMRRPDGTASFQYLGEPRRRLLPDGWESVGDLGWMDADGYLFLADRRDDLIITGGANVYPAEVEAAIDRHPAVVASAAYALPDADRGEVVAATVQIDRAVGVDELHSFLEDQLVPYKRPRALVLTREAVGNDAGKVPRSRHRQAHLSGVATHDTEAAQPTSTTQRSAAPLDGSKDRSGRMYLTTETT